jgi:hypothetical protein
LPAALDTYTQEAERFCEELDREHYLHYAGRKRSYEIEPIYERHADLFGREAVERVREASIGAQGEDARRLRYLLQFAVEGHLGQATRKEAEALAEREAGLELELDHARVPYRSVPVVQANEPDPERRAALERARNELLDEQLNPLYRAAFDRVRELIAGLGWGSHAEAFAELRGVDLRSLAEQMERFLSETDDVYEAIAAPELERAGVPALGELRRSDMPRFFRAPELDRSFGEDRLVSSFGETLAGLGIALDRQPNVHLDTERRVTKSPRAFCATPRVPDEVYLVVAPVGGRDDYAALFHEGGHTEHYAHTDSALPFEFRHLGDNGVTESFAFLLEHLTSDPQWLAVRLRASDPEPIAAHARAAKLVMLRRYAAKVAYELELHDSDPDLDAMPDRYARLLGDATRVAEWPAVSWLADVDPGFYVACYLRAWALETAWRRALRERFGQRWFESAEAGGWLRGLWRHGQRLRAEELLQEALGEQLGFEALAAEFANS